MLYNVVGVNQHGYGMYVRVLSFEIVAIFLVFFFFFNDTATTEIYTLSLHDALPILRPGSTLTFNGHLHVL